MSPGISPELIQALVSMGALDDQGAALDQRAKRNEQYAAPQDNPYGGNPWGALLGGAANVMRAGIGAYRRHGIDDQQKALSEKRTAGRDLYAQTLISALMGGGGPAAGAALVQAPEQPPQAAPAGSGGSALIAALMGRRGGVGAM